MDEIEWVLGEFRTRYFDFTAEHSHEAILNRPMAVEASQGTTPAKRAT